MRFKLRFIVLVQCLLLGFFAHGNSGLEAADNALRLATTTSTENSGLLQYLLPHFEAHSGYKVRVIAVGTGKALRMGKDGDADVLLVHAPEAEQEFVDQGYGVSRVAIMYNDFVIVGPPQDKAGLGQARSVAQAMSALSTSQQVFVSRADDSGTHNKELGLWQLAAVQPDADYYREAGQGMGRVLLMAGELQAYTLVDRGTWLAYKGKSPLAVLFEGEQALFNPYSMIALSPERHPHLNHQAADALINWMTSAQAQALIGDYKIDGEVLFIPDAKN